MDNNPHLVIIGGNMKYCDMPGNGDGDDKDKDPPDKPE